MFLKILAGFFLYAIPCTGGFMVDNITPPSSGILTDKHYIAVMDMLFEEKQARKQLEQLFLQLQQNVDSLQHSPTPGHTGIINYFEKLDSFIKRFQANMSEIQDKVQSLENNVTVIEKENVRLQNELEIVKQTKTVNCCDACVNSFQAIWNKVNLLQFTNDARENDFIALVNETETNRNNILTFQKELIQKIDILDQELNYNRMNDTETQQKTIALEGVVQRLQKNLTKALSEISENNQQVAITAFADGDYPNSNQVIRFRNIKSSTGVSDLSTILSLGVFKTEVSGMYLVAVIINSNSNGSQFYVLRNTEELSRVYIAGKDGRHDQSGTCVVSTFLNVGDVISIRSLNSMSVSGDFSSMSIIKVK